MTQSEAQAGHKDRDLFQKAHPRRDGKHAWICCSLMANDLKHLPFLDRKNHIFTLVVFLSLSMSIPLMIQNTHFEWTLLLLNARCSVLLTS